MIPLLQADPDVQQHEECNAQQLILDCAWHRQLWHQTAAVVLLHRVQTLSSVACQFSLVSVKCVVF